MMRYSKNFQFRLSLIKFFQWNSYYWH